MASLYNDPLEELNNEPVYGPTGAETFGQQRRRIKNAALSSGPVPHGGIVENHPDDEELTNEVVQARSRRSKGSTDPKDVMLDRYGTGQEMGVTGIPVAIGYEAIKPILRASPTANRLFGKAFGPEQMVGPNTQLASPRQALGNVGATALGAWSNLRKTPGLSWLAKKLAAQKGGSL